MSYLNSNSINQIQDNTNDQNNIVLTDYATNDSNLQLDKNVNPLNIDQTSVNLIEQNNIGLVNDEIQINMMEQNDVHIIQESNSNSNNFFCKS